MGGKEVVIGVVLAVAFLGALFAADYLRTPVAEGQSPSSAAAKIGSGFSGVSRIGNWTLVCAAKAASLPAMPLNLNPRRPLPPLGAQGNSALGRCRTMLLARLRSDPKQIVLAVALRLVGPSDALTMIVRLPPTAKKGDPLGVRLASGGFRMTVSQCEPQQCIAVAALPPSVEASVIAAKNIEFVLPPGPKGKRRAIPMDVLGLGEALGAMRRAES